VELGALLVGASGRLAEQLVDANSAPASDNLLKKVIAAEGIREANMVTVRENWQNDFTLRFQISHA